MGTTVEEPTFVKAFLSLLHSNGKVQLEDDYVNDELSAKPLTLLPEMPKAKVKKNRPSGSNASTINVTLKSIKAPKFTTTLECKSSDTIHSVKEKLGQTEHAKGCAPSSFRFLIKGKVASDTKLLSDLSEDGSDLTFTVMIKKQDESATPEPEPEPEPQVPVDLKKDDPAWTDIKEILVKRLGESDGTRIYSSMHSKYYN